MLCITKMRDQLHWMKVRVHDPRGLKCAPGWQEKLTMALSFVYQKHLGCRHGQQYVTGQSMADADRRLVGLEDLRFCVSISNRSVCYREHEKLGPPGEQVVRPGGVAEGSTWIAYVGTGRRGQHIARVKRVVRVPAHIAGWFTSLPVSWKVCNEPRCTPRRFLERVIRY